MSRAILVTGATGHQGGAVINALLAREPSDFLILAVTRNAKSPGAERLAAKSDRIKLVEGNLDATADLFKKAKEVAGDVPIWGVFSVQVFIGKGASLASEVRQGKALVDEAVKNGVQHLVYTSVERGGDERSWTVPTRVPHFRSKYEIELHLRDATAEGKSSMNWTILRPVTFMENLDMGYVGKAFMTMLRDIIGDRPLQWVATKDIGFFAAEAFHNPDTWKGKALGIAGDQLTFEQVNELVKKETGQPIGTTYRIVWKLMNFLVSEVGIMMEWFRDEGFGVDIAKLRELNPNLTTVEAWLKERSRPSNGR
ncbi:hypothetical protein VTJ49DRAFT_5479 [Mycothermus thermophilus]|uniref:NmrA-like domain-containing protein n=1 Tax=Humicola insolens TaxID=85995 RepID=A0ABR3V3J2_HUMIN